MTNAPQSNPFQLLGFPIQFDIDPQAIQRAYLAALRTAHPDAGGQVGGADAAELNAARLTLLDHEKRANTLINCLGAPSASELKDLPDGFLMEMMTIRQDIEEAIEQNGEDARSTWESWASEQRADYISQIRELCAEPNPEPDTLNDMRVVLNAWRYIERLIEQLDPAYDPAQADF